MNIESRIAVAIVLAAAIIGAAVMMRDANVTGFAAGSANLPPTYTAVSTKYALAVNTPLALNLAALFQDPEGQPLTFLATQSKDLSVDITGDQLIVTPAPGFKGERIVTVIASDGVQTASKRLKIEVGSAPVKPPAEPEFVPAASPAQAPPPEPPGQAKKPDVEEALEAALDSANEVPAIIILKKVSSFGTLAERGNMRKEALEERKRLARQAREAFKNAQAAAEITGAAVLGTNGLTVVHEYDTVNAMAVRLTRQALNKLKNDDTIVKIMLDRELTTDLADSVPLIDADDVWNLTAGEANVTGQNETICILDTGLDLTHSAFTGKIVGGYDYVNEDGSPQDDSSNSHGTHVAGIAAGNASPVLGVAKDAKIVPVKVCNSANSCAASDILAGIDYCNNNSVAFNISVMSISIGDNSQYTSATCPTLFDEALNTSVSLGIITAVASGNNGFTSGISYPACSPYVISVGSTTKADAMSSFTNRGGDRLDVLAPGGSIVSSVIGGGTGTLSGTSMATPHASGTIALVQQNQKSQGKPQLSLPEMRALLIETGKLVASWNRIDVLAAVVQMDHNYTINLTDNSVTNRTPPKAKVKFKDGADFSRIMDCAQLMHNFVEIDSAACPQYNKSARIMFEGLAGISASPLRNGEPCPAEICQNVTFSGGTLEFDVTEFTNYSSNSSFGTQATCGTCADCTTCAATSQTCQLTASISDNVNCINVSANNVLIDCDGFTITHGINGSNSSAGIRALALNNVTIQDCHIRQGNFSSSGDFGIFFTQVNNSFIRNNSIIENGTGGMSGITLSTVRNITIVNNTITTHRSLFSDSIAIDFNGTANNDILIINNTLLPNGTAARGIELATGRNHTIIFNNIIATGIGDSNIGIQDGSSDIEDSIIANNSIFINCSGSCFGITFNAGSGNITVKQNTITIVANGSSHRGITSGASEINYTNNTINVTGSGLSSGLITNGRNQNASFNRITVNGSSSSGIRVQFSGINNVFEDNSVTAIGSLSYALFFNNDANYSTFRRTIMNDPSNWINSSSGIITNLTNTTFQTPNGSIQVSSLVQVNDTQDVTKGKLNITSNRAFLNSSNLTFFNTAAILRFLQILFIDPAPFRDLEDDGTFTYCPPSVCAELSYANTEFVHNTTGFSFYTVGEGQVNLTINKTDSPDPVPASSQLNYTIVINNSGSSTAFNLTLLEIYPNEVIFLSAQPTPEAGTNNTFFIGNFTPESQMQLNITVFVRNITADSVINNTINATFLNQSNVTIRANVTEPTTVSNPAVLNMSSLAIAKQDSPDPVNASQNLTYVINVTGTGPGTSRNVTINDTYPPQVIFLSAQPTPEAGTNNTFFLGNITNGTSVLINITVLVRNITNGTLINNSANATFQNNTNASFSEVAFASTTVLNPPQINASSITVSKADSPDPVTAGSQLSYTITVTSAGGATAFNVTVNETYPSDVVFDSAQPSPAVGNTTFILGNLTPGAVVVINITVNVSGGASGAITNIVNASFQNETGGVNLASDSEATSITAAAAPAAGGGGGGGYTTPTPRSVFPQQEQPISGACVESWACEGWSQCADGAQVRTCVDLSQCNTTNYLPVTKRACEIPLPEVVQPEPEPLVLPELQPERLEPEVELPRWTLCTILPIAIDAMLVFLAALTIVLIFLTREQREKSHLKRAADVASVVTLILMLAHYAACGAFLPWQYIALLILAAFQLLLRLSERLGENKVKPKQAEKPIGKPAAPARIAPLPAAKPSARPARAPEPAHDEADMQDVFKALDRSAKVLERFRQTVKKGRK